ncbi:MAG: PAS domain S-box protein [candidate division WOR-3 bacterium]|nr:PAS domain S-box protein [candidate division WOR-3 bacterium]
MEDKTKEELIEELEKLIFLIEEAIEGIGLVDPEENFIFSNLAFDKIFGVQEGKLAGRNLSEFMTPEVFKVIKGETEKRKRGEKSSYEFEIIREDGERRQIAISAIPNFDKEGNYSGSFSFLHDITERKTTEEALKESREKYRLISENTSDIIALATLSMKSVFEYLNPSVRSLGYKPEELVGKLCFDIVHPDDKKNLLLLLKKYIKAKAEKLFTGEESNIGKRVETRVKDKTGAWHYLQSTINLVENHLLIIAGDITERRKVEEERQKVGKLESLGILAGNLAHDFNNFLTGVLSNISLAKTQVDPEDKIYDILTDSENAAKSARSLTQQLLTFSKGGEPIKERISIKELIKKSANFVLSGSKVKCIYNFQEGLWPIEADPGQISQVISNLVLNAVQAMPGGGVVNISAKNVKTDESLPQKEGRYVKVTIQDSGTGIPETYLMKIFDPFFTTKQKASGLGLSIAYSIVKRHEGDIIVNSEVGVGSSFYIYLPTLVKEAKKEEKKAEETLRGSGRVLVMDDMEFIRKAVSRALSQFGYEVIGTPNGDETIRLYREAKESKEPFDVVILDLTIPGGMGGLDTIRELKKIDPEVKAIVSSGYSDNPIMSGYEKYGFKAAVLKPYTSEELVKKVKNVIEGT